MPDAVRPDTPRPLSLAAPQPGGTADRLRAIYDGAEWDDRPSSESERLAELLYAYSLATRVPVRVDAELGVSAARVGRELVVNPVRLAEERQPGRALARAAAVGGVRSAAMWDALDELRGFGWDEEVE